ncbi:hypothetical protein BsWGS_14187 [Bradybaena similaris]
MTFATVGKSDGEQRLTFRLCLAIFGSVLGSAQYGYNLGVINSPETLIREFINESISRRFDRQLSENNISILWALAVSIFAIGGCCGGLFARCIATKFGRKRGCLLNVSLGVVASTLMFISRSVDSIEAVVIGRFIIGFHCGLYNGLVPMYLSEISTSSIRGGVGVVHQLGIVIGILCSQILGFPDLFGTSSLWNILLGLALVPCLLQAIILPFCPESPRFLLINKNDEIQCSKALTTLRGKADVEWEMLEIKQEMSSCTQQVSVLSLFRTASLLRPILIAIILQLSVQFSGTGGIFFYSTSLFRASSGSEVVATYTTSAVGGAMVVACIITIGLMDKLGRRTSLLIGLAGMAGCGVLITVSLVFRKQVSWFDIASIVCILSYVIFFTIGPGSVAWIMSAELFSHDARPSAMAVCVVASNLSNFTVGFVFPSLQKAIGDYVFLPFAVVMLGLFVFTFLYIPETKGKTFEEVAAMWRPKSAANTNNSDLQVAPAKIEPPVIESYRF